MRVSIFTLGCKVNQYETQALETQLVRRGHTLVPFESPAEVYIINTCTVTAVSDKKSRNAIRRARKRNPGAVVAVCGCYAQTDPQAVAALEVDLISGTGDRMGFLRKVEMLASERLAGRQGDGSFVLSPQDKRTVPLSPPSPAEILVDDAMGRRAFERLAAGGLEGRTRAMLKVEDGCVNFCSYCVIPYARGPVRSLPLADAVEEARRLAGEGYRELVLTGIEISSWQDKGAVPTGVLIDLMEAVCAAAPRLRVRLGSLEPRTVTAEFCRRAAALPNLCPHFHLSMQSGCDSVLARMNRKYDTARYFKSVRLLREAFRDPAITTDLIVGFPGESEAEFAATLAFVEQCAFSSMHIFPYSRRSGTPAYSMEGQVPGETKERRARLAGELAARLEREYLKRRVGEILPVLFEEEKDGLCPPQAGRSPGSAMAWRGHAPSYVSVYCRGEGLHNVLRSVKITGLHADGLAGELV